MNRNGHNQHYMFYKETVLQLYSVAILESQTKKKLN